MTVGEARTAVVERLKTGMTSWEFMPHSMAKADWYTLAVSIDP